MSRNNEDNMNSIQRDRYERRRAVRRKSMFTNIIVGAVILAIVIAIIVVAVKVLNKPGTSDTDATVEATAEATIAQPTTTETAPAASQQTADNNNSAVQQSTQSAYQQETYPAEVQYSTDIQLSTQSADAPQTPVSQGNTLHYYATGQTSYGYDWTYSGGGGIVSVSCTYDFNTKQYDFVITGISPGSSQLTLYYNTDDNVSVPVNLNVNVDSALNVTSE